MLIALNIKNVAVIESLEVNFHSGVTAFTGETGAGKSIIIDSINMILGARSSRDLIRYGTDRAMVQAIFEDGGEVCKFLNDNDIETEDNEIIITRTLTKEGKSSARINGCAVTLSVLRRAADMLINIHGQHDNQALLDPERHVDFLDSYAEDAEEMREYRELYAQVREIRRRIAALEIGEKERMQRIDLLEYQVREISDAKLAKGEEEELAERRDLLQNAERIASSSAQAYSALYEAEGTDSAYDLISRSVSALGEISGVNKNLSGIFDRLSEAMYTIEDAAHELRELAEEIEYDPQTLNDIEERLDLISKLKRKYGATVGEVIAYGEKAQKELSEMTGADELADELKAQMKERLRELKKAGETLSAKRRAAARELGGRIEEALRELDMEKARFSILVEQTKAFEPNGIDRIEFMISTNPGEPLKPLVKIASGGELSRVMLAIKSETAKSDDVDTLIFDEIDTGVSGSAAVKIARKLRRIGETKQVICITHLPQMTAAADNHYRIVKDTDGEMARTTLTELDEAGRIDEIARIIDGENVTETARQHARELIRNSEFGIRN